jgi:hypothetical protein
MTSRLDHAWRWLAREVRFARFSALLAAPWPPSGRYMGLLDNQARRASDLGDDALSFYASSLRRSWIRLAIKDWIRLQQAELKAKLGHHGEAASEFHDCITKQANIGVQFDLIRAAIKCTDSKLPDSPHLQFVDMLIEHRLCPEAERLPLLLQRAERLAADAIRRYDDCDWDSSSALKRHAASDYLRLVKSPSCPTELWQASFKALVPLMDSCDGHAAAFRLCAEQVRSDPTEATVVLTEWKLLLRAHVFDRRENSGVARSVADYAARTQVFTKGSQLERHSCLVGFAITLANADREHLSAIAWKLAIAAQIGLHLTYDELRSPDMCVNKPYGNLLQLESVIEAPLEVLLAMLEPPGLPIDQRKHLDHLLLGIDTVGQDAIESARAAIELIGSYVDSDDLAVAFVRQIMEPCGFGHAIKDGLGRVNVERGKGHMEYSLPEGIDEPLKDQIVDLLNSIDATNSREKRRDFLDDIASIVTDVAPTSKRVHAFVWLASTAMAMGYASNAEDYIASARKTCFRYEEPFVRLPLVLELCTAIRDSDLGSKLFELLHAIAMEGRIQAATTWMRQAGYNDRERQMLKDLEQEFKSFI